MKLVVGDIVTFSYEDVALREVPINPQILCVRTDISWEDVVANQVKDNSLNGMKFI
jgi:hypothetical protein